MRTQESRFERELESVNAERDTSHSETAIPKDIEQIEYMRDVARESDLDVVKSAEVSERLKSKRSKSPPVSQQWLPINTAPKDGTWQVVARLNLDCLTPTWWEKARFSGKLNSWCSRGGVCEPTHWMPLPAPPSQREGGSVSTTEGATVPSQPSPELFRCGECGISYLTPADARACHGEVDDSESLTPDVQGKLVEALRSIRDHPHNSYEASSVEVADGHRCAANIAREALALLDGQNQKIK